MRNLQLIGIAATVVAAPVAILVLRPQPAPAKRQPDVTLLQRLAEDSCRCERSHSGKTARDACWMSFNAAARPWRDEDEGSMLCGDPAEHSIHLRTGQTIVTRYISERSSLFCSKEEARTAQAAYDAAERLRERDPSAPSGDDVLDRLALEFARGDKPQLVSNGSGCTSG